MFIFVGEKPSARALEIGATWQNGKLAGKTLRDGLQALGIEPGQQTYCNLFRPDMTVNSDVSSLLAGAPESWRVVGMGAKVCQALTRAGIPHIAIIHPAARGAIRKTENYQAHLKERLLTK